jgi:hypothetical protein
MRSIDKTALYATILLASTIAPLNAQLRVKLGESEPTTELTPAQRAFTTAYIAAVTGPDISRYKALLHPGSRACMNPANAEYFETMFKRRTAQVAKSPKVSVQTVPDTVGLIRMMEASGLVYPARPTHAFHIDLVSTGPKQLTFSAFSVLEKGRWYEIVPCPTAKALEMMKAARARNDSLSARAKQLLKDLRDPLRGELLALLKDGQSSTAKMKYAEAAKVDLPTAVRVVNGLEELGR